MRRPFPNLFRAVQPLLLLSLLVLGYDRSCQAAVYPPDLFGSAAEFYQILGDEDYILLHDYFFDPLEDPPVPPELGGIGPSTVPTQSGKMAYVVQANVGQKNDLLEAMEPLDIDVIAWSRHNAFLD